MSHLGLLSQNNPDWRLQQLKLIFLYFGRLEAQRQGALPVGFC